MKEMRCQLFARAAQRCQNKERRQKAERIDHKAEIKCITVAHIIHSLYYNDQLIFCCVYTSSKFL